jgi:peptidoglycan hydrolase-like protein with peptidoglycan-binding domain
MAKHAPAWMVDDFSGHLTQRSVPKETSHEVSSVKAFLTPEEADDEIAALESTSPSLKASTVASSPQDATDSSLALPPPPMPAGPSTEVQDERNENVNVIPAAKTAAAILPEAPVLGELPDIIVNKEFQIKPDDFVDHDPIVKELVKGPAISTLPTADEHPASVVSADEPEVEVKASELRETELPVAVTPTPPLPAVSTVLKAHADEGTESTKDTALFLVESCLELRDYLNSPVANFGTKDNPSSTVERIQRDIGIKDDGIVGPQTREACKRIAGISLPSRRIQNAAPLAMPHAEVPVGIVANELPPVIVEVPPSSTSTSVHGNKAHECVHTLPQKLNHLQPIFSALQQVESANPTLTLTDHFLDCKGGLLGQILRESGGSWTAIAKERPRAGSTYESFYRHSYGPFQILDDTARSLYKWRHLLGSDSSMIRKPPDDDKYAGQIDPRLKAILCDPTNGSWYIALFIVRLENWASTFFDLRKLDEEGILAPGGSKGLGANHKEAELISNYINDKVATDHHFTPQTLLLRMYGTAGSIKGMANNIKNGRADDVIARLLKNIEMVESMTV